MMSAKAQTPMEARIFLSNCIDAMRMPLAAYSFAAVRVEQLVVVADEHIDEYTRLASIAVLRRCGLAERVRIMAEAAAARASPADADADRPEQRRARRPLSEQGGMDVESLSISVKNFYAMLFGGSAIAGLDALAPPAVDKITNVRARSRAKQAVAKVLGDAHADITAAVLDPYNQYGPDAASVVGLRDAAKVAVVLSGR
jgi:hypothetical protein